MGVALNTEYVHYSEVLRNSLRSWRTVSIARWIGQESGSRQWRIECKVQCKSNNGNTLSAANITVGFARYHDFGYRLGDNTAYVAENFVTTGEWKDVVSYDVSDTYYDSGNVQQQQDFNTNNSSLCAWINRGLLNTAADVTNIPHPVKQWGGIDFSNPQITLKQTGATPTSATIEYTLTAPYECNIYRVSDNSVVATAAQTGTGYYTIALPHKNENGNSSFYVNFTVNCANKRNVSQGISVNTIPYYVANITQNNVTLDIGDTVRIEPSLTTSDANHFTPDNAIASFLSNENEVETSYEFLNAYTNPTKGQYVDIVGVGKSTGILTISATDSVYSDDPVFSHTAVSKTIEVTVRNPAEALSLKETSRQIYVGETYKIMPVITPRDIWNTSSDTEIEYGTPFYPNLQSGASVTVTQDGVVTGVAKGVAQISVTLQRQGKTSLSETFTAIVVEKRPYRKLDIPDKLTFDFVDDVYNNILYIEDALEISAVDRPQSPQTQSGYEIPPKATREILNQIEQHLDLVYSALSDMEQDTDGTKAAAISAYQAQYTWGWYVHNPYARISRWITFINNTYIYISSFKDVEVDNESTIIESKDGNGNVQAVYYLDENQNVDVGASFIP